MTIATISYLPFHFRFWQCINRYYFTKQWFPHLVNAGKYLASILVVVISYFKSQYQGYQPAFITIYVFATAYSYAWDITMDWGLLKTTKAGRFLLRDRIKYPPVYYYFAIITNLILRCSWMLTLLPNWWFARTFHDVQGLILLTSLGEAYRRAQWSLFRVENENINNYEKYRAIQEIPKMPDEESMSRAS